MLNARPANLSPMEVHFIGRRLRFPGTPRNRSRSEEGKMELAGPMTTPDEIQTPPMNRAERRALAARNRERTPRQCACCAPHAHSHAVAHDHDAAHAGQPGSS